MARRSQNSEAGQKFGLALSPLVLLHSLPGLRSPPKCIQDSPRHHHTGLMELKAWLWPVGRFLIMPSLVGFRPSLLP